MHDNNELKLFENHATSEAFTHINIDALPVSCNCWDKNLNTIDCNHETLKLFDLSDKKSYMERFYELNPQYQPCGRVSSEMVPEYLQKAFNDGFLRFEWMHRNISGDPIPCEVTLVRNETPNGEFVLSYTQDLRRLHAFSDQMRAADERTRIMLEATPLCTNFWDKNLNNIDCNQAAVTLFELKSKQEYLKRFLELSPKYQPCGGLTHDMVAERINQAFTEGQLRFEWMHQKLNGEPVPAEITLVRVKYKGDYIVVGYTRDLREHKAMLAEMNKVETDLRLARDAAQESARIKSEFLANMSHEIRTPMNGILGMLHLTLNTELSKKQRDYLEKTELSAKDLLRILNDILDFSKIETGKLDIEHKEFSLHSIIKELKELFAPKMQAKSIALKGRLPKDLPATFIGDALRLKQVFMNIIDNAVKFTDENGHIEVEVTILKQSDLYCDLQFMVKDDGIGMTPMQVRNLFSPFSQADMSHTRSYGGTGLGLALSKNLINMMHGNIWAVSEYGKGSAFYFTLSLMLPPANAKSAKPPATPNNDKTDGLRKSRKAHVLLAEDNEINQVIAKELLEDIGLTVDIAPNGREALKMVKNKIYDMVLMDIQMPVMDGLSATRAIREDDGYNDLPIIAMSAHAMAGDREKSLECGMNDHLTKPIDPEILYNTLQKWLD